MTTLKILGTSHIGHASLNLSIMNKPTKITLVTVVVIVAFIAGGLAGKVVFSDSSNKTATDSSSTQATNNVKSQDLVSLMAQPSTAIGQTVAVSGNIYKVNNKDYYLVQPVETKGSQANSIQLDNGTAKLNLDQYASDGTTDPNAKPKDAKSNLVKVTVTGKVVQSGSSLKLIISSLKAN